VKLEATVMKISAPNITIGPIYLYAR